MEKTLRIPTQQWAISGMILAAVLVLYVLAFDQGFLMSLVQGAKAFDLNFFHEAFHDARHAAGFPCH